MEHAHKNILTLYLKTLMLVEPARTSSFFIIQTLSEQTGSQTESNNAAVVVLGHVCYW